MAGPTIVATPSLRAIDVLRGDDHDIDRCPEADRHAVNRLGRTPTARDAALDDKKVQVTVSTGRAARGRSKEDHPIRPGHSHGALKGREGRSL